MVCIQLDKFFNFDERGEFQNATGTKHLHNTIHVEGAPKLDPDDCSNDEEVIKLVDSTISTALPDKEKYPDFHALVKKVQTHHHTQTCKKKKGKLCRFDAPWPVTKKTVITRANTDKDLLKKAKCVVEKVCSLLSTMTEEDLSKHTIEEVLSMAKVSEDDYIMKHFLFIDRKQVSHIRED